MTNKETKLYYKVVKIFGNLKKILGYTKLEKIDFAINIDALDKMKRKHEFNYRYNSYTKM